MATSNPQFKLLHILGFGGLASIIGLVLVIGRYQASIDAALAKQEKTQEAIIALAEQVHIQRYQIESNDNRITKLEAK